MPSSFDLRPVQITHHPTQRIDSSISDLPKLTWDELLSGFSRAMKVAFGVDITSATGLATSIRDDTGIDLVAMGQMIDLLFGPLYDGTASSLTPEAIWHWVTTNHLKNWLLAADLPGFEGLDLEQPRAVLTAILRAAGNLSSGIRAALLGVIPIGLLDDDQPTLLLEGGYDTAETISVNSEFYWRGDDGVSGTNPVGSAWVDCDGTTHALVTDYVAVRPGWTIKIGGHVKRDGIDAAANSHAVSLRVLPFAEKGIPHGSGVRLASVASPAGSADWTLIQSDEWEVPAGVRWLVVEANVDEAATAGRAGFDEVWMQSVRLIPQRYTKNLPEDLTSLLNWITSLVDQWLTRLGIAPTGGLMDRIYDLGDELQLMQERGEDAWEALADKLGIDDWDDWLTGSWDTFRAQLLSNPGALLGQLGAGKITGLLNWQQTMDQIAELQGGNLGLTAINSVVQAVKDNLTSLGGKVQHLTSGGQLSASNLTNQDALDIVAAVRDGATDAVNDFTDGVKDAYDGLRDLFGLAKIARDIALTAQQQLQDITNDTQATPELGGMTWSTTFGGAVDSALPTGDWNPVSGLVIKESGHVGIDNAAANNSWNWAVSAAQFVTSGQSASVVLGPPRGKNGWDTLYSGVCVNVNAAGTSGAYAHIRPDRINFGRFTRTGATFTWTQLATVSGSFKQGDLPRIRYHGGTYHVVVNGLTKLSFTDTGNVIPTGAGYDRAMVLQQRGQFSDFFGTWTNDSWRIAGFAMSDWLPAGVNVTAASWRLRRGAGGEVALSVGHGGQAAMPSGFYTVNDLSNAVTVTDLGTGQVEITESGWYEIAASSTNRDDSSHALADSAGTLTTNNAVRASPWVLLVDGVAIAGPIPSGTSVTTYLAAGQVVRPGVSATVPVTMTTLSKKGGGSDGWGMSGGTSFSKISHVSGAPSASFTGRKVAA